MFYAPFIENREGLSQSGSRLGLTFRMSGLIWATLFAKVNCRCQKSALAGKELNDDSSLTVLPLKSGKCLFFGFV